MPSTDPRLAHQRETRLSIFEHDLRASLPLADRWFIETLLPLRYVETDRAEEHERALGFGDVEVSVRHRVFDDPLARIDLRLGLSLPLGESGPPFQGAELRERYLFGSGTFDPIAAVQANIPLGRDRLISYLWVRAPVTENIYQFRAGVRATLGIAYAISRKSWGVEFGAGGYHQSAAAVSPAHSLSAAHDDIFATATVEFLKDGPLPLGFALLLPLTVRVGDAAAYHSPWTFSFSTRFSF